MSLSIVKINRNIAVFTVAREPYKLTLPVTLQLLLCTLGAAVISLSSEEKITMKPNISIMIKMEADNTQH